MPMLTDLYVDDIDTLLPHCVQLDSQWMRQIDLVVAIASQENLCTMKE